MEVSLAEHARKERREQCMKSSCCVVMSALLASGLIQLAVQSGAAPAEPDVPPATAYAAACSAHQQCATQSGDCCPTSNGVLMSCCDAIASSAKVAPFSGMRLALWTQNRRFRGERRLELAAIRLSLALFESL